MGYPVRRVRRSRSHRRRRARRRAIVLALLALTLFSVWGIVAVRSDLSRSVSVPQLDSDWAQGNSSQNLAVLMGNVATPAPAARDSRPVYPYSVIPGGVRTPEELLQATVHDQVVARHYSDFDFKKARVIELKRARLAYLSYRIGEKIYWTKRQFALRKGEMMITDGKVTARTRCGNQVSELPQKMVSPEEPLAERFDEPIADGGSATQMNFPGSFESALLTRPEHSGFGAAGPAPLSPGPASGPTGGGFPGIFPPPVPSDSCSPTKKPKAKPGEVAVAFDEDDKLSKKKKKRCHPGPPPPTVPEPGTILLVSSGVAGVYVRYRKVAKK